MAFILTTFTNTAFTNIAFTNTAFKIVPFIKSASGGTDCSIRGVASSIPQQSFSSPRSVWSISNSRVQTPGLKLLGSNSWVQTPGFKLLGSNSWVQTPGFTLLGSHSWAHTSGFSFPDFHIRPLAAPSSTILIPSQERRTDQVRKL
jgi:hypothetical protein